MERDLEREEMDLYRRARGESSQRPIICPRNFKKQCKLCDRTLKILFDRSIQGALRDKARDMNAKPRYFSNVIFPDMMGNEPITKDKIVVFSYGDEVMRQLIMGQRDAKSPWKNFMMLKGGRTLVINKITSGKQPKYYVEAPYPPEDITFAPDVELYDLTMENLIAQMDHGLIKPYAQSKLKPERTEIRILIGWMPEYPTRFWEKIDYHYNITEEDFEAVQRGEYDPITGEDVKTKKENLVMGPPKTKEYNIPSVRLKEEEDIIDVVTPPPAPKPTNAPRKCFGGFDPTDPACTDPDFPQGKCGWASECETSKEKMLEQARQRKAAKQAFKQ